VKEGLHDMIELKKCDKGCKYWMNTHKCSHANVGYHYGVKKCRWREEGLHDK
jgi:hypothetical protein